MINNIKLSIIIPIYNEKDNIKDLIAEIENKIKIKSELLFVYDFDEDNTLPLLRSFMNKKDNIVLIKNKYNSGGVLNAIRSGFEKMTTDVALVMMADLSDELEMVDLMYNKFCEGAEIVCASRYMKGGQQIGGPFIKSFLSKCAGLSLHYLIKIPSHDATNNFRLYSKKLLDSIDIESSGGFELGIEILVKAYIMGFKVVEVPSTWKDRVGGESRFKLIKWLPKYLKWYLWAVKKHFSLIS